MKRKGVIQREAVLRLWIAGAGELNLVRFSG